METINQINQYWQEHKNDSCINLPKKGIKSRLELFKKHLKQKKVLHVGCTDWPDTMEKLKKRELLHQYLENLPVELYGIDINKEGVEIMQKNGIKNVFVGDINNLHNDKNLLKKKFDILLISEVIEHLPKPGLALESVKTYIQKTNSNCEIIFTIPNYHNFWRNFLLGLRGKETVNSDHKFYFSYRTFRALIDCYGFKVNDFCFVIYENYPKKIKGRLLLKILSKISPCLAPYLYFRCHFLINKQNK